MIAPKEHFHGSDLEKIEKVYGIKKEEITSFSANVNPLGISPRLRATLSERIDAITGYPDREYTSLRRSIATYCGADMENILVGNGSTELISLFIQFISPKKSLILAPTYSEYEREIGLTGGEFTYFFLEESNEFKLDIDKLVGQLNPDLGLLVMCNPNNPTSSAINKREMNRILETCKKFNIFCLVDETYAEFTQDIEEVTAIPLIKEYNNLIILRGISKFFAAPGLRLGYAICSNLEILKTINERKNPWSINTLAAIAGEIMFTDTNYIQATKDLIDSERNRIFNTLSNNKNIKLYPPVANFILIKILKPDITASQVFDAAI
ncbi:MAG: Histidinol-phosphate/aromatic aminotransferase and cobyric acid decarboxylase, partial [Anaerocolumna sp.]|nr:Histidinol-phosphate/aromatic aminotransferase and cobyric acid decarboxylase [Anaerocolumna sp.]